jgi:hypothetical protein
VELPADPDRRAALARQWTRAALAEHASIASFARFSLQLLAVGAPPDLLSEACAAAADEVRHAEICFALASRYAGRAVGPGPLAIEGSLPAKTELLEMTLSLVGEGCIGETIAAVQAAVDASSTRDPVVQACQREIAQDEQRHATLAWRALAWALPRLDAPARARVAALFAETAARPDRDPVARSVLDHVVLPLARRLLGGRPGPRTRDHSFPSPGSWPPWPPRGQLARGRSTGVPPRSGASLSRRRS